jgi:hypothetical protein
LDHARLASCLFHGSAVLLLLLLVGCLSHATLLTMSSSLEAKLVVLGAQGKGELKMMLDTGSVKGKKEREKERKRKEKKRKEITR